MKYSKNIIMCLSICSLVFSAAKVDVVKAMNHIDSDHNVTMSIESENPVYGIQFEMKYNIDEIAVVNNSLSSTVEGFKFDYRVFVDEGKIRALMFSLEGTQLTNSSVVTDLVNIEFEPVNGFNGISTVDFSEFIIAGQNGEQLESDASSFEVDFNQVLIPTKTELTKNYPNPFNPVTNIDYSIATEGFVSLIVYNLKGAAVKTIVEQNMVPGNHQVQWDGTNNSGENVASGRYIVKMNANDYTSQIKMTLLK